jgi:hypothetical protein
MNAFFKKTLVFAKVFGQVFFLYGLLSWIYGVIIQLTNPQWLPLPMSHLTLWLRTDTFTILSFFVSAIGFLVWRLCAEMIKAKASE